MPSLIEILKSLGVTDPSTATDEQWNEAAKIMQEEQKRRWGETDIKSWGIEGKTPEEQRKKDEENAKKPSSPESKG